MASSINASTAGGGGIITTADATGNLDIQSGGSTVVAVTSAGASVTGTLSATGAVTLTGSLNTPNTFGFKNRIINGGMVIDQRNAGASGTAINAFTVDRFAYQATQASKGTWQQNAGALTPVATTGFTNYLGFTSSSSYSVLAGDYFLFQQSIEGFNTFDLAWGTASASAVTLSFKVYSSLTGTFGGSLCNGAYNRSYPFSYSIPVANTWTTISVTIAGDTSGTWVGASSSASIISRFSFGVGSTYSGTAGAWAAANVIAPTGAVSVVGTSGATFYITGVQLEKGSTATSFDFRDYGRELALCQRYYWQMTGTPNVISNGFMRSTTVCIGVIQFPVTMRTAASLNVNSGAAYFHFSPGGGDLDAATLAISGGGTLISQNQVNIQATASSGTSTTGFGAVININSASAYVGFSAEL